MRSLVDRFGRWLHILFEASLFIKGTLAVAEAFAGLGLLLAPNARILSFVDWLTKNEIAQDQADPMATWMRNATMGLSIESQHFYALYLLGHGVLKLLMVVMLARRVVWAYPVSILILLGFVAYQMHRWTVEPSPVLLVLSGFDLLMAGLVWREWRGLRRLAGPQHG